MVRIGVSSNNLWILAFCLKIQLLLAELYVNADQSVMNFSILNTTIN